MTESELLDALRDAFTRSEEDPDGAHTTAELEELTRMSRGRVKKELAGLLKAGKAEVVWVRRYRIDGQPAKVPAYRALTADISLTHRRE